MPFGAQRLLGTWAAEGRCRELRDLAVAVNVDTNSLGGARKVLDHVRPSRDVECQLFRGLSRAK